MREKNKRNIIVEIRKPLFKNFAYVREKYLLTAIENGVKIEIRIPQGAAVVDPKTWMKTGKRMEKVFKFPNSPLVLYGNYVTIEDNENQKTLFGEMSHLRKGVFRETITLKKEI